MFKFSSWLIAAALTAAGCSGGGGESFSRYPVRGTVTAGGEPAAGVVVRFAPAGAEAGGVGGTATTDTTGAFKVSALAPDDGLPAGKYTVTFQWPDGGGEDAEAADDKFRGRYTDPAKSKFTVEVKDSVNDLPAFELTGPAKAGR